MKRETFFKDKGLLFSIFVLQTFSLYLHFVYISQTCFFLVPVALFGFLGLLELWFIIEKGKELTKNVQEMKE